VAGWLAGKVVLFVKTILAEAKERKRKKEAPSFNVSFTFVAFIIFH